MYVLFDRLHAITCIFLPRGPQQNGTSSPNWGKRCICLRPRVFRGLEFTGKLSIESTEYKTRQKLRDIPSIMLTILSTTALTSHNSFPKSYSFPIIRLCLEINMLWNYWENQSNIFFYKFNFRNRHSQCFTLANNPVFELFSASDRNGMEWIT